MRVRVGGPLAHCWTNGVIESWTRATLDIDDEDEEKVGYFRQLAAAGHAVMLDDPGADAPPDSPAPAPVKAAAKTAPVKAAKDG